MEALDPELSASTGLTNDVCGRLSLFTRGAPNDEAASALPTPSKEGNDDVNEDGFVEVESPATHAMFELSEEELLRQRNEFVESISVLSAFPGHDLSAEEAKQKIGEALYAQIAEEEPTMAGKLTGMFLQATENHQDLVLLIFSPTSLQLHLSQAKAVLEAAQVQSQELPAPQHASASEPSSPGSQTSPSAAGVKRIHRGGAAGAQQFPYNGKRARIGVDSVRPFFAEIVDDSGKRTRVPCKYDTNHAMYVPTGGRDPVPGGKVGTRDKTAQDLQALPLGESDEAKLSARQKQIDIGRNTEGFRRLQDQGMTGRELQDAIGLPYITLQGTLELTLKCSKKRYDGYLRMWKRKLYAFAGLNKMDFKHVPVADAPPAALPSVAEDATAEAPVPAKLSFAAAAKSEAPGRSGRKQGNPKRAAPVQSAARR